MNGSNGGNAETALCLICGLHPQTAKYRPFCSKRCADIDLHRWLGGVYAVAGDADAEEDEMPPGAKPANDAGEDNGGR
jgi:uncharacterized protein